MLHHHTNLFMRTLALGVLVAALSHQTAHATIDGYTNVTGANAAVIVSGGDIPNPVTQNPNDGRLVGWNELQNVTLTADLRVDRVFDENASFVSPAPNGDFYINAGTVISSHYFQWDPGNGSAGTVNATIQLDSQAFAFITADQNLFDSDVIVGLPGIDYNDFGLRGLEGGDTTNFNGPDVDISWSASSPGDWTRLITAFSPTAAPELTTDNSPGNPASLDFGLVRIGTTATGSLEIDNTGGDQPSGLTGTVPTPAPGEFALDEAAAFGPIAPGATETKQYSFNPVDRGTENLSIGDILSNDADGAADGDAPVTLTGTGVGPDAAFALGLSPLNSGETIDLLANTLTDPVVITLTISNDTTDADGGNSDLTDLTLNSIAITGADSANFDLLNFTPGQVVAKGGSFDLQIELDPAGLGGLFDALLTINTDQSAALAGDGDDFQFTLAGESVPEPASLMFVGLGSIALLRRRR